MALNTVNMGLSGAGGGKPRPAPAGGLQWQLWRPETRISRVLLLIGLLASIGMITFLLTRDGVWYEREQNAEFQDLPWKFSQVMDAYQWLIAPEEMQPSWMIHGSVPPFRERLAELELHLDTLIATIPANRMAIYDPDGLLGHLKDALSALSDQMSEIEPSSRENVIKATFIGFGRKLHGLFLRIDALHLANAQIAASTRQQFLRMIVTILAWGSGIILVILAAMALESIALNRSASENAMLAEKAESASRAKSRFLTMMNHELRTPMNGMMGLLALLRQSGLTERQERLLVQSERSGQSMTYLLGDILDYSELLSEKMTLASGSFATERLKTSSRHLIDELTKGRSITKLVELDESLPEHLSGDPDRLEKVIRHIVKFSVDVIETQRLEVSFFWRRGHLEVHVLLTPPPVEGPGWQPEALLGQEHAESGKFATDAIGPAIARGLIARMGGNMRVVRGKSDTATVICSLPAPKQFAQRDFARVEAKSTTGGTILESIVRRAGWEIWTESCASSAVKLVVVELTGDESSTAARLRVQHPMARLVAIGTPAHPELFDAISPSAASESLLEQVNPEKPTLFKAAS